MADNSSILDVIRHLLQRCLLISLIGFTTLFCTAAASQTATNQEFVGSLSCAGCHATEFEQWQTSHHKLAMQEATEATVLGDFSNAIVAYNGIENLFFKRDSQFWVRTDNKEGLLEEFRIAYTFGVYPLQQYLIGFPDGRYQPLSLAWDSRSLEEGGQRWFHLYPDQQIGFNDILHWTHAAQNWNTNCAECHSTDLVKNYDPATNQFNTQWSDISVGCEGCHGPASGHLAWAAAPNETQEWHGFGYSLKSPLFWNRSPDQATATPSASIQPFQQQICANCHSLRLDLSPEPGSGFHNSSLIQLIEPPFYYADGQVREENFEFGSFLQSKMHMAGVTCSNCHNPHDLSLVTEGNGLCAQCHNPAVFDQMSHTHHQTNTSGSACVSCHMPATLYMQVDSRRDHSFLIPRPDINVALGIPDPCSQCHSDMPKEQLQASFATWYPDRLTQKNTASALAPAWAGDPAARPQLLQLIGNIETAPMIRASALRQLHQFLDANALNTVRRYLSSKEPLERRGALLALESLPLQDRLPLIQPLLQDPVLSVRMEAARLLAGTPDTSFSEALRPLYRSAVETYLNELRAHRDQPNVNVQLASTYMALGDAIAAESSYLQALKLEPALIPALLNLADLYRATGRDTEAKQQLEQAISLDSHSGDAAFSLGLLRIREGQRGAGLDLLKRAVELSPDRARYAYVYAVGLAESGQLNEAITVLKTAQETHPFDRDLLYGLGYFWAQQGNLSEAIQALQEGARYYPQDAELQLLLRRMMQRP